MKKTFCSALFIVLLIFSTSFGSGFGISGPHSKDFPLKMNSGQTIDTYFKIQNTMSNTGILKIEAILEEGSEIATFLDGPIYNIPAGEQVT